MSDATAPLRSPLTDREVAALASCARLLADVVGEPELGPDRTGRALRELIHQATLRGLTVDVTVWGPDDGANGGENFGLRDPSADFAQSFGKIVERLDSVREECSR